MYVILVYDICTEEINGKKRLPKIFKLCKRYLCHVQKSVFEGEITPSQLEELKILLDEKINPETDSIIIFKNRDIKWMDKELLGVKEDKTDNFI